MTGEETKVDSPEEKRAMIGPSYQPTHTLSVSQDIPTLGADYVKVLVDADTHLVTFLFFQRHVLPKQIDKTTQKIDAMNDNAFLEVKVPWDSSYPMAIFLKMVIDDMRAKGGDFRYSTYGPNFEPK